MPNQVTFKEVLNWKPKAPQASKDEFRVFARGEMKKGKFTGCQTLQSERLNPEEHLIPSVD